ncbi:MAG: hypothetical protein WCG28_00890 [bacterium]
MINVDWKKFIITFFITISLFAVGIFFGNYLSNRKINQVKNTQDKISIDILSSETRFALLKQSSCEDLKGDFILSDELTSVGSRLDFLEATLGVENEDVTSLKKYYSILEIRDYLLMREISTRCGLIPHFILYFYSMKNDCPDCSKQWYVLTEIRNKYPELRVYTFDYNINLSAVRSLLQIFKIKNTKLPTFVLDDVLFSGFYGVNDLSTRVQKVLVKN